MQHADAYQNTVTGLGTSRDKGRGTSFVARPDLDPTQLDAIYEQEGLGARIVDRVVDDATREPFELVGADKAFDWKSLQSELEDLDAVNALADAWRWSRLYGGSLVVLVVNDATPMDQPMMLEKATKLLSLQVVESIHVTPASYRPGLGSKAYRCPEHYELTVPNGEGTTHRKIHRSRTLRFDGTRVPPSRLIARGGWGPSVLQRCEVALNDLGVSMATAGTILHELSLLVLSLEGFTEKMLASAQSRSELRQVFETMRQTMDNLGLLVIDKKDSFSEQTRTVTGLDQLLGRFVDALVRATGMPRTILLGEQPGGLNANADSEVRGWYDHVAVQQGKVLTPPLTKLLSTLMTLRGRRGEAVPTEWTIEYATLWQPSEKERADTRLVNVQADSAQIESQVTVAEEVRKRYVDAGEITPLLNARAPAEAEPAGGGANVMPGAESLAPTTIGAALTVNEIRTIVGFGPKLLEGGEPDPTGSLTAEEAKAAAKGGNRGT